MCKYTSKGHPDYELLTKAADYISSTLSSLNKRIDSSASEDAHKLLAIAQNVEGDQDVRSPARSLECNATSLTRTHAQQIVRPGRKFVREGLVKVKRKQSRKSVRLGAAASLSAKQGGKSYLFVFQDIIVHCEQVGKTRVVADDGEKPFVFVGLLKIRDITSVQPVEKEPRKFRLLTADGSAWELKTASSEERAEWESDIVRCMSLQMQS